MTVLFFFVALTGKQLNVPGAYLYATVLNIPHKAKKHQQGDDLRVKRVSLLDDNGGVFLVQFNTGLDLNVCE